MNHLSNCEASEGRACTCGAANTRTEAEARSARQEELPERCPTCAAPVKTIFDHIDIDCEHD